MAFTKLPSDAMDALVVKSIFNGVRVGPDPAVPATRLRIYAPTQVGADDGASVISLESDLTLNSASSGVNGLDTGAIANGHWYFLYLIYNPTLERTRCLLSLSSTSPTLPSGYTQKRRIGAAYYSSGQFRKFYQRGRKVTYSTGRSIYSGLPASGWSNINLVSLEHMPPTACWGSFQVRGPHTGMNFYLSPDGDGTHFVASSGSNGSDRQDGDGSVELILPNGRIYLYRSGGNSENTIYIWLSSYEDDLD